MRSTWGRIAALLIGILLIVLGIAAFSHPIANSVVVAYVACILMIGYGVAEIVHYCSKRKASHLSGWVLADGIISTILGVMLLFMPGAQILGMAMVFAFWTLFTGVTRTSAAFAAKDLGLPNWGWILAAGILGCLIGMFLMFNPLYGIMAIGIFVPMVFIMQGISAISMFFATRD